VSTSSEQAQQIEEERVRNQAAALDQQVQQRLEEERRRQASSSDAIESLKATLAQQSEVQEVVAEQAVVDTSTAAETARVEATRVEAAKVQVKPTTTIDDQVQHIDVVAQDAKLAQQELAKIIATPTPETSRLTFVAPVHNPNTPSANREAVEVGFEVDRTEKSRAILESYEVRNADVQAQVAANVEQVEAALKEVHPATQQLTPQQIDDVNNVLIDFHKSVQRSVERDVVNQAAAPAAPLDTQQAARALEAQQAFEEQARLRAQQVADEVTAQVIRQNRQLAYLEQIDDLRRDREAQAKDVATKDQLKEVQQALHPETHRSANIDPRVQALVEQRRQEVQNTDRDFGTTPPDINDPRDRFGRPGGGGDDGVEFETAPYDSELYGTVSAEVYAVDENGIPTHDHTQKGALGAGVSQAAADAGIDKGDNARNVSVVETGTGHTTLGPGSASVDFAIEHRFEPNSNN
jgi:hypothetical protein